MPKYFKDNLILLYKIVFICFAVFNSTTSERSCYETFNQCGSSFLQLYGKQLSVNTNNSYTANMMTNNIFRIGGLFEIDSTRKQNAISEYKAVQVALKHVNENRVLDEYMLDMVSNDSKVRLFFNACIHVGI